MGHLGKVELKSKTLPEVKFPIRNNRSSRKAQFFYVDERLMKRFPIQVLCDREIINLI